MADQKKTNISSYVDNDIFDKLNKKKAETGISITRMINDALKMYFKGGKK